MEMNKVFLQLTKAASIPQITGQAKTNQFGF